MSQVKCCFKNLLETSTVILSAGAEDANYPLYRSYDRDIGKVFKAAAAVTIEIKIDQGASGNLACDRLLIPAGHNLSGMTLDMKYSDNDSSYASYVSQWVQGDNNLIDKSWASSTHRYKKFIITSPASIPQLTELFLTQSYIWERNPSRPTGNFLDKLNVERDESVGGHARFFKHGDPRKYRNYPQVRAKTAQKDNAKLMHDAWAGSMPFYLYDHEGIWIFGEILKMEMSEQAADSFPFSFEFQEVLPG
ncbi:MAG: hypothetical protein HZB61_10380 [Nitrospirae bacterium]|nr:hypothetical protein [Nitrospirota bacterium]